MQYTWMVFKVIKSPSLKSPCPHRLAPCVDFENFEGLCVWYTHRWSHTFVVKVYEGEYIDCVLQDGEAGKSCKWPVGADAC